MTASRVSRYLEWIAISVPPAVLYLGENMRGHLKAEGAEQTGSQSYIPPDPKDDKALHTALDLIRGIQKNSISEMSPQIIPLKDRTDLRGSSRNMATETVRV
jgi:hypothetical protein